MLSIWPRKGRSGLIRGRASDEELDPFWWLATCHTCGWSDGGSEYTEDEAASVGGQAAQRHASGRKHDVVMIPLVTDE